MKKRTRIISLLLCLTLLFGIMPINTLATGTEDGFANFTRRNEFSSNTFEDVTSDDWCFENVKAAYQLGLMIGDSLTTFNPDGDVKISETITIAARLHSIFTYGKDEFEASDPWYDTYVDYALTHGIIASEYSDYNAPATRAEFAYILASALPASALEAVNKVADGRIPDVDTTASYAEAVYMLYRAGVLVGNDAIGTFLPESNISRGEVAAIASRMAVPSLRKDIQLGEEYTVTFDTNGGSSKTTEQVVFEGELATQPKKPSKGMFYTFEGWFTAPTGGVKYDFNTPILSDITLYAHWTFNQTLWYLWMSQWNDQSDDTYYTVTFDANGGTTPISSVKIVSVTAIGELPEATKDGHTFLGWYTDATEGTQITSSTIITENMTVYAHWITTEIDSGNYRVTFDKNDGSAGVYQVQWVDAGQTASEPTEPTRDLYRFTGWYLESAAITKYDFSTPVISDLTLYAGWGNPDGSDDGLYAASNTTETIFSVSDISVEGDDVSITYNTNNVALISVEFFEDQMENGGWSEASLNNNLSIDPISTTSGYTASYGELATITLPITGELPDYYLVRARMYDGTSTTEYITAQYTKTYAEFNAQTVDDFDADRVISFDGSNNTNFGVIKESVIVVPTMCRYSNGQEFRVEDIETTEVSDQEMEDLVPDHLFTFPNKNAVISTNDDGTDYTLSDLEVGDVIYVEGTTWMFKIKTIQENEDGSISFTQDKDVTMLDFYDTLKVDFEGVEASVSNPNARWEVIDVDGSGSATLGFNLNKEFSNGVKFGGTVSGTVTGNVKLSYDAHLFSADYFEASFEFTTQITGEIKAEISTDNHDLWQTAEFQVDAPKIKLPTPVTGLEIYIKPSAKIDWELSGEVSFNWTSKQTSGFKYNSDTGRTDIKKKENTVSIMAKGKAEAKVGPIIDIGVDVLGGVLSGGVVAEAGAKVSAEAEIGADDLLNNADSKHACGLCVSGRADWYASAYVKCSYKITNSLKGDIVKVQILDFTAPITFNIIPGKFFFSIINSSDSHFGGYPKFGGGDCTNKTYRTEFIVQDGDGNNIDGIEVTVIKQGSTNGKSGTTPYVVYLYDGTHKATAVVDGSNVSKTIAVSGERQTVILTKDSTDSVLEGTVVDANDQSTLIAGVSVKISKGDVVIATAETDSNGKFNVAVPSGSLTVELSKEGYLPFSSTETVHEGDATHSMGQVELTPGSGMGGIHGVIRDAVTNEPLADVTLNLYEGWNNQAASNTAVRTLTTNDNGEFRVNTVTLFGNIIGLKSGNYTLTASKEGYSDTSYNIVVYPGTTDENPAINETMSPEMDDGYYRIVLTWGVDPRDLDSHMVAETSSGGSIHVAYYDKNPDPHYANLDVDDTSSYGPETVTITNFEGLSNIRYAVHDYTNRYEEPSNALSNSGAVVRIYKGNTLLRTFNVPTGYGGTEWDVFELKSDGTIVSLNTMTYNSEPQGVITGASTWSLFNGLKDYELIEVEADIDTENLDPNAP